MNGQQKIPESGFYLIHNKIEKNPVLVHGYRDKTGIFVFGFNVHDGGGFFLTDMTGENNNTGDG
jgi:hypothetical protein